MCEPGKLGESGEPGDVLRRAHTRTITSCRTRCQSDLQIFDKRKTPTPKNGLRQDKNSNHNKLAEYSHDRE